MNAIYPKSSPNRPGPEPTDPVADLALQLAAQATLLVKIEEEISVARKTGKSISTLETDESAVFARIEAIRALIGHLEAKSLVGAAAQIMLAYNEINFLGSIEITNERQIEPQIAEIERLCRSALSVVMREVGIDPRDIGADYFADDSTYPFPTEGGAVSSGGGDTKLLDLAGERKRLLAYWSEQPGVTDEQTSERGERLQALEERIIALPTQSFAGLAAKLDIASHCICPGADTIDDLATLSALRDAERLAGHGGAESLSAGTEPVQ